MKKIAVTTAIAIIFISHILGQAKVKGEQTSTAPISGLNYNRLSEFLNQQKWQQANEETLRLLLIAAKRNDQGWLTPESIQQVACEDLTTMNDLWTKASNNRFGFSSQLAVYLATGNRPGKLTDEEAYTRFGDAVGWRKDGDWISFKGALNYTLDAPKGHLPYPRNEYEVTGSRLQYTTLTQRLVECQIGNGTPPSTKPVPEPQTTPENMPSGPRINL